MMTGCSIKALCCVKVTSSKYCGKKYSYAKGWYDPGWVRLPDNFESLDAPRLH